MPNVMADLLSIGGALYSTLQSVADAHYQTTTAKMRKPLKFRGVPETRQQISAEVHHIMRTCAGGIGV